MYFINLLKFNAYVDILFDTVCKQYCKAVQPSAISLSEKPSERNTTTTTSSDRQHDIQLYCGYCYVQCKAPADLVKHCKHDNHKHAVFADSGRDASWELEPPSLEKNQIALSLHW